MEYDLNSYSNRGKGNKHKYKKRKRAPKTKLGKWWRKRKKWQKAAIITAVTAVLIICMLALSLYALLLRINNKDDLDRSDLGFTERLNEDIYNIALFGIDTRDQNTFEGNSDSIMILSINTKENKIKLISVMRDTLVPIENKGKTTYGKINSVYAIGGPQLAIKTLNTLFGLDIADYATVNFFGMSDIIDAVDGVDVELTKDEIVKDYGLNTNINEQCSHMNIDPSPYFLKEAGTYHLNGIQAVAYARIRHIANVEGTADDYGRTDRQRLIMKLLLDKALKMPITSYPSFVSKVLPYLKTSLSDRKILALAQVIAKKPSFEQTRVPETDYQIDGDFRPSGVGSCVYYNLDFARKIIRAFIYENIAPADYIALNGVDKTPWYKGKSSGNTGNNQQSTTPNGTASSIDNGGENTIENNENGGSENQNNTVSQGTENGNNEIENQNENPNQNEQSGTEQNTPGETPDTN